MGDCHPPLNYLFNPPPDRGGGHLTLGYNLEGNRVLRILFIRNKDLTPAERKKKRKLQNTCLRRLIQLAFFFLMPGSFVAGFSGVKYLFQQIGEGKVLEWNSFILTLVILCAFTIVFGRFFCGFVCAFGSLGDFIFWISGLFQKKLLKRKKQIVIPDTVNPWAQKIKYLVLAAAVMLCALGFSNAMGAYSSWTVFSFFLAFKPRVTGFVPGLILLLLILAGMAFKERFFCQFLCPLGALFSLLPHLPFANLKRKPEECIKGCSACRKQCPVDIRLEQDGFKNGECIGCERCADICPKANLTRWDRKLLRHEAVSVLLKAILFFVLGLLAGLSRI